MANGTKVNQVTTQALECGESPVWDEAVNTLYWTNSGGSAIYFCDLQQDEAVNANFRIPQIYTQNIHVAALCLHARGGLMCAGKSGFFHISGDHQPGEQPNVNLFNAECEGQAVKDINEIIADAHGRVMGGQEKFQDDGAYQTGYLFQIQTNGQMCILEEGLHTANGMGFSPDHSVFYLTDTISRSIYAYDYALVTGKISARRTFLSLEAEDGLPDGMAVDREGHIWTACWFGAALRRYRPDGTLERKIKLPVSQPTSLCFAGHGLQDIYITSAAAVWESSLAPPAYKYPTNRGGGLYHIKQDVQGKPAFKARV